MTKLSKQFLHTAYGFIDGKLKLSEFEKWIYNHNSSLEGELDNEDFTELISFSYNRKDARHQLIKLLEDLLSKYLDQDKDFSEPLSIKGVCLTNRGHYSFSKEINEFDLTVGRKYDILSINIERDAKGKSYFQYVIMDDKLSIYYVPSEILQVEFSEVPHGWVIDEYEGGWLSIEPKEWSRHHYEGGHSFWKDFHNDNEVALIEFVKVLHRLNLRVPSRFRPYAFKIIGDS